MSDLSIELPPKLVRKLEAYRQADEDRHQLLRDLFGEYHILQRKYDDVAADLANEQASRRQWQSRAQSLEKEVLAVQQGQQRAQESSSPVVTVLIDGDGAPFLDELYAKGSAGGSEAASRLYEEIRKTISGVIYPDQPTSHWSITVTIFIHLEGMQSKLRACGLLRPGHDLSSFCQAFVRNQPLFQVVDVGFGKEQADYKLREWFRLAIATSSCKHIILGGISHDSGYLPMLEPYKTVETITNRVSIMATVPVQPAYMGMKYRPIRADTVFRSDHLPMKPGRQSSPEKDRKYSTSSQTDTLEKNVNGAKSLVGGHVPDKKLPGSHDALSSVRSRSASPSPASWANVSKIADSSIKSINIASNKSTRKKFILKNEDHERLDAALPPVSKGDKEMLYSRINTDGKVCNIHYLRGDCDARCGYRHDIDLTTGEVNALRQRARKLACSSGLFCEDFDCVFGHMCPFGKACRGDGCAFEDSHNISTVAAYKLFEGQGGVERLVR